MICDGIKIFSINFSVKTHEHPVKAFPILVTEEGIVIWVNDKHSLKEFSPIEVTEEWIVICVNDEKIHYQVIRNTQKDKNI